jgi:hypothetical protein
VVAWETAAMAQILFEDIFDVKDLNTNGKKFERGDSLLATTLDLH